jgi:hypothetical protein
MDRWFNTKDAQPDVRRPSRRKASSTMIRRAGSPFQGFSGQLYKKLNLVAGISWPF